MPSNPNSQTPDPKSPLPLPFELACEDGPPTAEDFADALNVAKNAALDILVLALSGRTPEGLPTRDALFAASRILAHSAHHDRLAVTSRKLPTSPPLTQPSTSHIRHAKSAIAHGAPAVPTGFASVSHSSSSSSSSRLSAFTSHTPLPASDIHERAPAVSPPPSAPPPSTSRPPTPHSEPPTPHAFDLTADQLDALLDGLVTWSRERIPELADIEPVPALAAAADDG